MKTMSTTKTLTSARNLRAEVLYGRGLRARLTHETHDEHAGAHEMLDGLAIN